MLRKLLIGTMLSTALTVGYAAPVFAADEVEVLHWWTSGGEASALDVLKKNLESQGVTWKDMPVAGGGGEAAMTALRARVTAGDPPTAVQALGFDITDWAKQGVVGDLGEIAEKEGWDKVIPAALQAFSKYDGKWIAAPVNVHSTNWIWINKKALDAAGGKAPESWDELIAVARQDEGQRHLADRPWRPGLAGRDDLRRRRSGRRHRLLQAVDDRSRPGGAGRRKDGRRVRQDGQAQVLCRRRLLRPRLEPGFGDGHRRQGRHAVHGRLGQGRVHQGRPEAGHRLRLHPLPGYARRRSPSTPTSS